MGIVQGLAEYLPISSSGHLEICREILGLDLTGAESIEFDVMLHVATVLSTIVVLWREFMPLCTSFFTVKRDANFYYVLKILVSCIPVGIVGLCFKEQIEQFFGSGLLVVGICLCVTAVLLAFAYFFRTSPLTAKGYVARDVTWTDAFIIVLHGYNPHPWRGSPWHERPCHRRPHRLRRLCAYDCRIYRFVCCGLYCLQMDAQHREAWQNGMVCRLLPCSRCNLPRLLIVITP